MGRDVDDGVGVEASLKFQSTRPVWGATMIAKISTLFLPISIHAPRVGRDRARRRCDHAADISIHAPRVGRDVIDNRCRTAEDISIHAPRVGRDQSHRRIRHNDLTFQSTRPVWGATDVIPAAAAATAISIHAPRVGRDDRFFQILRAGGDISIHAPRVGRDAHARSRRIPCVNFNPRAPCGARR